MNLPGTLGQTRRKPTSLEAKPCQAVPPSLPRTFSIPGGAWVGLFYWGCKSQLPGQFTFSEGLAHPFGPSEVCWEYPEASCSESPSQHVELAGSVDTGAGAEGFAGHGTLGPGRDQEWADATTGSPKSCSCLCRWLLQTCLFVRWEQSGLVGKVWEARPGSRGVFRLGLGKADPHA